MAKISLRKTIEDFFRRLRFASRMLFVATDKSLIGKYYEEPKPEVAIVHQTTEIEPDIVVYSKEEIELKYVAIDKLFEMQSRFSKQEYLWIKQMVTDEEFLRIYFNGTNNALVEYLKKLYDEGKFTKNILDAMSSLGMVVLEYSEEIKFINFEELYANIPIELLRTDLCEEKDSYTKNNKKS